MFRYLILALSVMSASADLMFSAGFSDDAVFQRSAVDGHRVYGFVDGAYNKV